MARLVRDSLQRRGYTAFMDVEDLRSGPFNTALFGEIESAADVIVILTPGSLDRCGTEGDWLRLEVAHAIQKKKNIVPVMARGFAWPREPLPDDLAALPGYNGLAPSHEFFEASMGKLARLLVGRPKRRRPRMKVAVAAAGMVVIGVILLALFGRSLLPITPARGTVERPAAPVEQPVAPVGQPVAPAEKRGARVKKPAAPVKKSAAPAVPAPSDSPIPPGTLYAPPANLSLETNSIGMKMVLIPAGEFTMGSSDGPPDQYPPHKVRITKPFYLGQYEATAGQFRQFIEKSNYNAGTRGRNAFSGQTADCPVVNISWYDAKAFCDWLSRKEGKAYRLPTEAEWEYACRAGAQTAWSFGDDASQLGDYAWYEANSGKRIHPVGQKKPNPWGLYDVYGNADEWCADSYGESYYASSPAEDPTGPSPIARAAYRVLRGGSWNDGPNFARSFNRFRHSSIDGSPITGFRVARTP
jgi:formylglycine-generating enzyme required for sulfatase activity